MLKKILILTVLFMMLLFTNVAFCDLVVLPSKQPSTVFNLSTIESGVTDGAKESRGVIYIRIDGEYEEVDISSSYSKVKNIDDAKAIVDSVVIFVRTSDDKIIIRGNLKASDLSKASVVLTREDSIIQLEGGTITGDIDLGNKSDPMVQKYSAYQIIQTYSSINKDDEVVFDESENVGAGLPSGTYIKGYRVYVDTELKLIYIVEIEGVSSDDVINADGTVTYMNDYEDVPVSYDVPITTVIRTAVAPKTTAIPKTTAHIHQYVATGAWKANSSSKHVRLMQCSCGAKTYTYANHQGNPCTLCGYRSMVTQPRTTTIPKTTAHVHRYTSSGTWMQNNANTHKRISLCSCGKTLYTYQNHKGNPCSVCGYSKDSTTSEQKVGVISTAKESRGVVYIQIGGSLKEVDTSDRSSLINSYAEAQSLVGSFVVYRETTDGQVVVTMSLSNKELNNASVITSREGSVIHFKGGTLNGDFDLENSNDVSRLKSLVPGFINENDLSIFYVNASVNKDNKIVFKSGSRLAGNGLSAGSYAKGYRIIVKGNSEVRALLIIAIEGVDEDDIIKADGTVTFIEYIHDVSGDIAVPVTTKAPSTTCSHSSTKTTYTSAGSSYHIVRRTCTKCLATLSTQTEVHSFSSTGVCSKCGYKKVTVTTKTPTTRIPTTRIPTTRIPTTRIPTTRIPKTTSHIHSYAAATCTTPKKCTICGATTGIALGHSYTVVGNTSVCSRCGKTIANPTTSLPKTTTMPSTISISGSTSLPVGSTITLTANISYNGLLWTIDSGSEYATLSNSNGSSVSLTGNKMNQSVGVVIVRVTNPINGATATKTVHVLNIKTTPAPTRLTTKAPVVPSVPPTTPISDLVDRIPPLVANGLLNTSMDTLVSGTVPTYDNSGSVKEAIVVTAPLHALSYSVKLDPATQRITITYRPIAGYQGVDTIRVAAIDASGNTSSPASITIVVVDNSYKTTKTTIVDTIND